MNERIQELYLQAVEYSNGQMTFGDTREFFAEKFAELIVRECMKLCTEVKEDLSTIKDVDKRDLAEMSATFCYDAIKDEFGIKES